MKATEVHNIHITLNNSEQRVYNKVIDLIKEDHQRGQDFSDTIDLAGFPKVWEKLKQDGYSVIWHVLDKYISTEGFRDGPKYIKKYSSFHRVSWAKDTTPNTPRWPWFLLLLLAFLAAITFLVRT